MQLFISPKSVQSEPSKAHPALCRGVTEFVQKVAALEFEEYGEDEAWPPCSKATIHDQGRMFCAETFKVRA